MITNPTPRERYRWRGDRISVSISLQSVTDESGNLLYITAVAIPNSGGDAIPLTIEVSGRIITVDEIENPDPEGYTLIFARNVPLTQLVSLNESNDLNLERIEEMVDRATLIMEGLGSGSDRAFTAAVSDSAIDQLPAAVTRAGLYLAFDVDGDPVVMLGALETDLSMMLETVRGIIDNAEAGPVPTTVAKRGLDGGGNFTTLEADSLAGVSLSGVDAGGVTQSAITPLSVTADKVMTDRGPIVSPGQLLMAYHSQFGLNSSTYATGSINTPAIAWSEELGLFTLLHFNEAWTVHTSTDGKTWSSHPFGQNGWEGAIWSPELGIFVVVGAPNRCSRSSNGVDWAAPSSIGGGNYYDVCWSPELGLLCASGTNRFDVSLDSVNWEQGDLNTVRQWRSVCWSAELGIFCAVSASGGASFGVAISSNGINWTEHGIGGNNNYGVCWSKELGLFCSVNTGSAGSFVRTSPDGINWTPQSEASYSARAVTWAPELGLFIAPAFTSSFIMISDDGVRWFNVPRSSTEATWKVRWAPSLGLAVTAGYESSFVFGDFA